MDNPKVNAPFRVLVVISLFVCHFFLQGRCNAASEGFLSVSELQTAASNNVGSRLQDGLQLLYPAIKFTESASITQWTFVADIPNSVTGGLPQLQVWRSSSFVSNTFDLINSTGSMNELGGSGPLYQYVPATPIPVMSGDVLGIYIPQSSSLLPRFKDVGNADTYYSQAANQPVASIPLNSFGTQSRFIPYVAVKLGSPVLTSMHTLMSTFISSSVVEPSSSLQKLPMITSPVLEPHSSTPSLDIESTTPTFSSAAVNVSPSSSTVEKTIPTSTRIVLSSIIQPSDMSVSSMTVEMPVETVTQEIAESLSTTVLMASQSLTIQTSPLLLTVLPLPIVPTSPVAAVLSSSSLVTQEPTPPVTQANNSTVMVVAAVGAVFAILILVLVVILVILLVLNNRRRKKQLKDVASTSILEARGSPASGLGHLDNPVYQGVVVKNDSPTVTVSSSYDHSDMHNSNVLYQTATSLELWNDLYQTHHTIEDKEQSGIYHEANHTPSDVIQNSIYHEALTQSTDDEGHYEMASPYELPVVNSSAQPAEQQVPVHYEQLATTEASTSSSQTGVTTEAPGHYEFPATAVSVTTELPHPAATGLAASYEQPATTSAASNSVESAVSSHIPAHYEQPTTALATKSGGPTEHHYSMLDQNGIYVPSEEERAALGITEECSVFDENCYSEWGKNQLQTKSDVDKMTFFEQCDIYWRPATQASVLYDQLAKKKYREIKRSDIQIIRHLGSGQFGTVNEGVWHCPWGKQQVAVKMLRVRAVEQEKIKLLQEAAIMGQFVHPNVVRLHGVVTVGEPMMIAIELMTKGDLTNYLRSIRTNPSQRSATSLPGRLVKACRQVTAGMVYLSKKCFVHRDLAARNVLVNENETCKIGDFGMSRDLEDEHYYVSHGGKIPVKWTAPEALHYKKYSTASDVWSFGVLMYEIWSLGHKPFEEFTNPMAIKLIESGYRLPPPPGCPKAMYQLMMECWHPDGSHRPTFSSILSTLSLPLSQLLHWSDGDRAAHQHADCLGGSLEIGQYLYQDIQHTYFNSKKQL